MILIDDVILNTSLDSGQIEPWNFPKKIPYYIPFLQSLVSSRGESHWENFIYLFIRYSKFLGGKPKKNVRQRNLQLHVNINLYYWFIVTPAVSSEPKPGPSVIKARPSIQFPGVRCRFFPSCTFGTNCRYEHPVCPKAST